VIRIEITCDHADQPRARDVKNPCDSTRKRSLDVDVVGTMDDAVKAVRRVAQERGWQRVPIQAIGRRLGYICGNCHRRHKGEI
jgi:hypothetical protein